MDRVLGQFEEVAPVATATPGAAAWTAREAGGGRRVLIKRLPDGPAKTRATQSLALRHPRIVPTRRWLRDEGHFYVVRDWVAGTNLRQALSDVSRRAFDRLQTLLSPILDALDYAHECGLPHGGLSPENVLVADGFANEALLCDFATWERDEPSHLRYAPRALLSPEGLPTPRSDFYALCELYKEFLPTRPADDEAATAARVRLLRNLTDTQETARSVDELRYKLDAVAKMADLLGFSSNATELRGARLVCALSPPTATLNPGGGTTLSLALDNEGDMPLYVDSVASDQIWLNLPSRFQPFALEPGAGGDLIWTLSGARLASGTYQANLTIRSNDGLKTPAPARGQAWPEQVIAVPVVVKGGSAEETYIGPRPPIERLPLDQNEPEAPVPTRLLHEMDGEEHPGIACVQEPDPGLVRYGQNGVLHLGLRNIGAARLRVDKVVTRPNWLVYPGTFQSVWIEPGATQFLGLSVQGASLAGGDYKAEVTFTTSTLTETLAGSQPVWRDLKCEVRVRVVRGEADVLPGGPKGKTGCAPIFLALASSLGLLGLAALFWR